MTVGDQSTRRPSFHLQSICSAGPKTRSDGGRSLRAWLGDGEAWRSERRCTCRRPAAQPTGTPARGAAAALSGFPSRASVSKAVLTHARALVNATRSELTDPDNWCQGEGWACDEKGESLGDSLWEAARSPHAYSRELLAAFLHQAWRHGYVVEPDKPRGMLRGVSRAPATVWVAAEALAEACLDVLPSHDRHGQTLNGLRHLISSKSLDERVVLALSELNEHGTHAEVLTALDQAERILQAELDRRAQKQQR